jgi:hypothetical protein
MDVLGNTSPSPREGAQILAIIWERRKKTDER